MDALQMLKEDHDKVKKLLSELDSTTERGVKTRSDLFTKVKQELQVHEAIEEEIFYPALKEHPKAKELVLEAYEEHNVVDMVMQEIEGVPYEDETWGAVWVLNPDTNPEPDALAALVRQRVGAAGGHAALIRASEQTRRNVAVFHPQAAGVAALSQRVRHSFDPKIILNRGRMLLMTAT